MLGSWNLHAKVGLTLVEILRKIYKLKLSRGHVEKKLV